jgi:hypothetical protein
MKRRHAAAGSILVQMQPVNKTATLKGMKSLIGVIRDCMGTMSF